MKCFESLGIVRCDRSEMNSILKVSHKRIRNNIHAIIRIY